LTIATLALALVASGSVWAQTQTDFTDQKLDSFVVAAIAVDEVIREWNPRIEDAENAEQAARLREEANGALVETIARTDGITLDEYQAIGEAAQSDQDLATRINEIYQEKAGNCAPAGARPSPAADRKLRPPGVDSRCSSKSLFRRPSADRAARGAGLA
jgi:hypothetical protein